MYNAWATDAFVHLKYARDLHAVDAIIKFIMLVLERESKFQSNIPPTLIMMVICQLNHDVEGPESTVVANN